MPLKKILSAAFVFVIVFFQNDVFAQGDGPRTYLLAPKGIWGINAKWMDMSQNLVPAGTILVKDAKFKVNVFPTTLFHTFGIKGRYAQLMLMVNPGSASGDFTTVPGFNIPKQTASGFSDGFAGFKIGLIGAPALNVKEFTTHKPKFSMMAYGRVWYSGNYDSSKPLNLGTNRTSIEMGFPMNILLFKNARKQTWLETYPALHLFTANNEPVSYTRAKQSKQTPLLSIENHLTHSFSKKFWAGLDLRYQYGGATKLDGVDQDNTINILGGGISAGYQFLPFVNASTTFGTIFFGDNGAYSDMFRLSLVFVYANMKKLKG
jgi:hypothetical protein